MMLSPSIRLLKEGMYWRNAIQEWACKTHMSFALYMLKIGAIEEADGDIIMHYRKFKKWWASVDPHSIVTTCYGSPQIPVYHQRVKRFLDVDRLVWSWHIGLVPDEATMIHRDGNSLNCRVENLFPLIPLKEGWHTDTTIYGHRYRCR